MDDKQKMMRVECPECGYKMPIWYEEEAECRKVRVACKGRQCKNIFEIRIEEGKQQIK